MLLRSVNNHNKVSKRLLSTKPRQQHVLTPQPAELASIPLALAEKKQVRPPSKDSQNRKLILDVLSALPSQREARTFLQRFNQVPSDTSKGVRLRDIYRINMRTASKADDILSHSRRHDHLGLIKLESGLPAEKLRSFAGTLVQLQSLGLTPLVVLDSTGMKADGDGNIKGSAKKSGFSTARLPQRELDELDAAKREKMTKDAVVQELYQIAEAIDEAGGRAMALNGGIFHVDSSGEFILDLESIQTVFGLGQIPIIGPIVESHSSVQRVVPARDVLVALCRKLSADVHFASPVKTIIVNRYGGIATNDHSVAFVNLEDEYDAVKSAIESCATASPETDVAEASDLKKVLASQLNDLDTARTILSVLPSSSSAIIASAVSSAALISNLITDKSPIPHSSSGPSQPSKNRIYPPTILRHGLKLSISKSLPPADQPRMLKLLESSFKKKLDADSYWRRLDQVADGVIVAGAYDGAAIVTMEPDPEGGELVPYLDKFAVAPTSQGIGVADILWKALKSQYPDLVWRSRADNPVNKWYFERSDGNLKLPGGYWMMFWYGSGGLPRLNTYKDVTKDIAASFFHPPASDVKKG